MSKPKVNLLDIEFANKVIVNVPVGKGEYMYHEFSFYPDDSTLDYVLDQLGDKYEITE